MVKKVFASVQESKREILYHLPSEITQKCSEAIFISGSARSGTTIMGKIVHSFKNVEYRFEPPLLFPLFALLPVMKERRWRLLFENYLYNEILVESLTGRSINCNREDDSSIYKVKAEKEINERLTRSFPRLEIENRILDHTIALKMPDIVHYLPKYRRYYPKARIVIMLRKAGEVILSILKKGWFTDEALQYQNSNWPNRLWNGKRIPFWVELGFEASWDQMDEVNRAAYYYLQSNRAVSKISDAILIKYDDLVENPEKVVSQLSEKLNVPYGEKTKEILDTIERRSPKGNNRLPEGITKEIEEEAKHYSSLS